MMIWTGIILIVFIFCLGLIIGRLAGCDNAYQTGLRIGEERGQEKERQVSYRAATQSVKERLQKFVNDLDNGKENDRKEHK